jgi:hypothetical protein
MVLHFAPRAIPFGIGENPVNMRFLLVLPVRIELTTSPLPRECSTTELRQRDWAEAMKYEKGSKSGRSLPQGGPGAQVRAGAHCDRDPQNAAAPRFLNGSDAFMAPSGKKMKRAARDARLAGALRANLRRRKAKAQALARERAAAGSPATGAGREGAAEAGKKRGGSE